MTEYERAKRESEFEEAIRKGSREGKRQALQESVIPVLVVALGATGLYYGLKKEPDQGLNATEAEYTQVVQQEELNSGVVEKHICTDGEIKIGDQWYVMPK